MILSIILRFYVLHRKIREMKFLRGLGNLVVGAASSVSQGVGVYDCLSTNSALLLNSKWQPRHQLQSSQAARFHYSQFSAPPLFFYRFKQPLSCLVMRSMLEAEWFVPAPIHVKEQIAGITMIHWPICRYQTEPMLMDSDQLQLVKEMT